MYSICKQYTHIRFLSSGQKRKYRFYVRSKLSTALLLSASIRIIRLVYLSKQQFQWFCQSYGSSELHFHCSNSSVANSLEASK